MLRLLMLYYVVLIGLIDLPLGYASSEHTICNTKECHQIANIIYGNMDSSAQPCTNFYEYGCGSWKKLYPKPSHKLHWSASHEILLKTHIRLKASQPSPKKESDDLLEEEVEHDHVPFIDMVKRYYRSCMHKELIEKQALQALQDILDSVGGWPMTMPGSSWYPGKYSWQQIYAIHNRLFPSNSLFVLEYVPDVENRSRNIITISNDIEYTSDKLPVEDSELLKEDITDEMYKDIITKVVLALVESQGRYIDNEKLYDDVKNVVEFKRSLKKLKSWARTRSRYTEKQTFAELQRLLNKFAFPIPDMMIFWKDLIQDIFAEVDVTIDDNEPLYLNDMVFVVLLLDLLQSTPVHVIVNYLQWNLVEELLPYLNENMANIILEVGYQNYNLSGKKPRWRTCIQQIKMQDALSYLFVKKYTSVHSIKAAEEVVTDIEEELKRRISQSMWLSDIEKNSTINNINNAWKHIGYPDWYNNETALVERYEGLDIGEIYFNNAINCMRHDRTRYLKNFRKLNKNEWQTYPISVDTFYPRDYNAIVLSAAEMQDPYFTPGLPLAINYGVVGFLIGHEFVNNFNRPVGTVHYDEEQCNATNKIPLGCHVEPYSKLIMKQIMHRHRTAVPKRLSKDEEMATSVGMEVVFAAYQNRKNITGPQPKLPGLENITDEQLFYLSAASAWCTFSSRRKNKARTEISYLLGHVVDRDLFFMTFNCSMPRHREECVIFQK